MFACGSVGQIMIRRLGGRDGGLLLLPSLRARSAWRGGVGGGGCFGESVRVEIAPHPDLLRASFTRLKAIPLMPEQAELVAPMIGRLAHDIGRDGAADLHWRRREAERTQAQRAHLPVAHGVGRGRLLLVVNAEAGQKPRQPAELESLVL